MYLNLQYMYPYINDRRRPLESGGLSDRARRDSSAAREKTGGRIGRAIGSVKNRSSLAARLLQRMQTRERAVEMLEEP